MKVQHTRSIKVISLQAFDSNYIWLILNLDTKSFVVIDPGLAKPVCEWMDINPGWSLSHILITHHHDDHTGGIADLKELYNPIVLGSALEKIPCCDIRLDDGSKFNAAGLEIQVLSIPGHTLDHLAYYIPSERIVFTGDTLFSAGCGRIFEGTPLQMQQSLNRLALLPDETLVYCAHEYTLANLKFAETVDPFNMRVKKHLESVSLIVESGGCTLPSSIALEKSINPFLRILTRPVSSAIRNKFGDPALADDNLFAALREWKNRM